MRTFSFFALGTRGMVSLAWHRLYISASSPDWFIELFAFIAHARTRSKHFRSSFTTFINRMRFLFCCIAGFHRVKLSIY